MTPKTATRACIAEAIGTYILVFLGTGAVHAAVLASAQSGVWQVAVVWGAAVALAIYATAAVSGAHINPAVTIAFATFRGFPWRKVPGYIAFQVAGAALAAATLHALFRSALLEFEAAHGIARGLPGSELSAMVYGEYFPNPLIAKALGWSAGAVTPLEAMLAEAIGTALLVFFVFALTDPKNPERPGSRLSAPFIGFGVAAIISVIAPLTQAGLNPARDFGPRLVALAAGFGRIAIPGPRGGFLSVYVFAPIVGGLLGAVVYHACISASLRRTEGAAAAFHLATRRSRMRNVQLIILGGFLGAGKTTLLFGAASRLAARGRRVGLITNDQAPSLVDTALLAGQGFAVGEVAGSCFCCNFPGLLAAAEKLGREVGADILIAEPVGSCTDLSATILQPLKDRFSDEFSLAPLSVLVDPARLEEVLGLRSSRLHDAAVYIVRKQLEEADIIVLNKIDAVRPEKLAELLRLLEDRYPRVEIHSLSALTGEGVDAWLDRVLAGGPAGESLAEVDYDRYAEGEAALGWLNATVRVEARAERVDWRAFSEEILRTLVERLRERGAEVGHLKLVIRAGPHVSAANVTRLEEDPTVRGEIPSETREALLVLNARAVIDPEDLERIAREGIDRAASQRAAVRIEELASLRPARPRPTHRYARVVPHAGSRGEGAVGPGGP